MLGSISNIIKKKSLHWNKFCVCVFCVWNIYKSPFFIELWNRIYGLHDFRNSLTPLLQRWSSLAWPHKKHLWYTKRIEKCVRLKVWVKYAWIHQPFVCDKMKMDPLPNSLWGEVSEPGSLPPAPAVRLTATWGQQCAKFSSTAIQMLVKPF